MGVLKPWLILILPIASRLRPAPSRCHTQFGVVIVNPAAGTRVARPPAERHARPARDFVLSRELVGHARGHDVLESALKIGAVAQVDGVFHAGVDNPVMPSRRVARMRTTSTTTCASRPQRSPATPMPVCTCEWAQRSASAQWL